MQVVLYCPQNKGSLSLSLSLCLSLSVSLSLSLSVSVSLLTALTGVAGGDLGVSCMCDFKLGPFLQLLFVSWFVSVQKERERERKKEKKKKRETERLGEIVASTCTPPRSRQ